jgi:hypothetical protein
VWNIAAITRGVLHSLVKWFQEWERPEGGAPDTTTVDGGKINTKY